MLKLRILHLLEEMDGMCLDNEPERMEVAARLAEGLVPKPTEEGDLDDLLDELGELSSLDWDDNGSHMVLDPPDGPQIRIQWGGIEDTAPVLSVGRCTLMMKPHQRINLYRICRSLLETEQQSAVGKALGAIRLMRKRREDF